MKLYNKLFAIALVFLGMLLSCSKDDNTSILNQQQTKIYTLESVDDPAITGSATLTKNENGSVTIDLELANTLPGELHPAHIHYGNAVEGGGIALTLESVPGDTGKSSITVTALDDGTPINYNILLQFNGYINVHQSEADLATIVAQGDIGENELTGDSVFYDLIEQNSSGLTGTAEFYERNNGEALAVINTTGSQTGTIYTSHIHENDAVTTGPIALTFNSIDGDVGFSRTNISELDDTSSFLYEDILTYNGYINIHNPDNSIAAQGNIGVNEEDNIPQTFVYDVSNTGTASYDFNGNGFVDSENPDLTLVRGNTYVFNVNTPSHPFYIKTVQGNTTADVYSNGVTGNGVENGTLTFVVTMDAPNMLFYNCQFHTVMTGVITITD